MTDPLIVRIVGLFEVPAGLILLALAVVVRRSSGPQGRLLSLLLTVEGLGQLTFAVHDLLAGEGRLAQLAIVLGLVGFGLAALCYLLVVRTLDTPLVAPIRSRAGMAIAGALVAGPAFAAAVRLAMDPSTLSVVTNEVAPELKPYVYTFGAVLVACFAYTLAAAISAWRRADVGSMRRKQAGAYAVAFGARDAIFIAAILGNVILSTAAGRGDIQSYSYPLWPLGTLVYGALLAYGILRLHLFDVELKIKAGISRSAVATIGIIAVLAAAKVAESYLSRTLGFVAGGVAAGIVLFLAPRLNKLGDKVANAALPNVQPTPAYLTFKKLEVYRAAVESAVETGGLTEKDRAALDRLRSKLGLAEVDTRAVEAEVSPG